MAVSAAVDFILFRQRDSSRILAYTSSSGLCLSLCLNFISILAFTFVADIICIDYVRTVIGQTKQGNEENETSDETRPRVEPYYITCMTITILGAVLAVVSTLESKRARNFQLSLFGVAHVLTPSYARDISIFSYLTSR